MASVSAEWYSVGELAAEVGVTRNAIHAWLKRNNVRRGVYVVRGPGGQLYLHPQVAEAYRVRHGIPTGEPTAGMVPLRTFAQQHGESYNRLLGYCQRGRVRCVRYKRRIYADRYQLAHLLRNPLPPGTVWAAEAARERGLTTSALLKRLRRRGLPVMRVNGRGVVRREDVLLVAGPPVPAGTVPAKRVAYEAGVTREAVTAWMRAHGYQVFYKPLPGGGGNVAHVTREAAEAYLRRRRGAA